VRLHAQKQNIKERKRVGKKERRKEEGEKERRKCEVKRNKLRKN
jgi:hypothetical protein